MWKLIALSSLCCMTVLALHEILASRSDAAESTSPTGGTSGSAEFQPVIEAPLPAGFPTYTPVGKIELKRYPSYRKAEASGRVAFWTLFQHIKRQDIEMTAPVEMTYQTEGAPVGRERSMAFLYGDKNIGSAGQKGKVAVIDVPAATVVSFGMRGARSDQAMSDGEQRLRDWLEQHQSQYVQDGPVRVMGYNSPFVERDRQFFEVQIPVREVSSALGD